MHTQNNGYNMKISSKYEFFPFFLSKAFCSTLLTHQINVVLCCSWCLFWWWPKNSISESHAENICFFKIFFKQEVHLIRPVRDFPGGPRLPTSTAGGMGSIPGGGTKIPHAARRKQK